MEFGMAVKPIFRDLRGFGVDERNPRLAPPFRIPCPARKSFLGDDLCADVVITGHRYRYSVA